MSTVLVVEDDPDVRELVRMKLQASGYEVGTAPDGEAGIVAAERIGPDLIVLDWMMPGRSGIEVCLALRARPRFEEVPIIMVTARAQERDLHRGLEAGATGYLVKPFALRELVEHVTTALSDPPAYAARLRVVDGAAPPASGTPAAPPAATAAGAGRG